MTFYYKRGLGPAVSGELAARVKEVESPRYRAKYSYLDSSYLSRGNWAESLNCCIGHPRGRP